MHTYGTSLIRKDGETPLFDGLGSERTVTNPSRSVTASLTLARVQQKLEKAMGWSFTNILHPLTVIVTSGYLLFHFVQVRRMPPERAVRYTGSLVVWLGVTLMAADAVLSDLGVGSAVLVGTVGFGLVVYGFYLNERRDKRPSSPGAAHPKRPGRGDPE